MSLKNIERDVSSEILDLRFYLLQLKMGKDEISVNNNGIIINLMFNVSCLKSHI